MIQKNSIFVGHFFAPLDPDPDPDPGDPTKYESNTDPDPQHWKKAIFGSALVSMQIRQVRYLTPVRFRIQALPSHGNFSLNIFFQFFLRTRIRIPSVDPDPGEKKSKGIYVDPEH